LDYVVKVAINNVAASIDKLYDYKVSWESDCNLLIGCRVFVPFGRSNKTYEAYIFSLEEKENSHKLKWVKEISDEPPLLDEKMIELVCIMKEKYICSYMDAIRLAIPPGASIRVEKWVSLLNNDESDLLKICKNSKRKKQIVETLFSCDTPLTMSYLSSVCESDIYAPLSELEAAKVVSIYELDEKSMHAKMVRFVKLAEDVSDVKSTIDSMAKNSYVQKKMLEILCDQEQVPATDLIDTSHGSYSAIHSLYKKELVEYFDSCVERSPLLDREIEQMAMPTLNDEQRKAADRMIEMMKKKEPHVFLLHGITGSGKTEVFMTAAEFALKRGQSVLILVSEISLTPQLTERFLERFGGRVAILHSRLSLGERFDMWRRIKEGKADVIIGARSAVFAPCSDIGLIVLDEEHESSYKSETIPRYHARDIAFSRAKQYGATVVLSSATPSIESYYYANRGVYEKLELQNRYSGYCLPPVTICDMTKEMQNGNTSLFSESLKKEIAINLNNGEQTILFLNRRGFSGFVSCRSCGFVPKCPHCSISLTYHRANESLVCHYCGYQIPNYKVCPSCFSKYIKYFGAGTQRVEAEIKQLFPDASVLRMDIDTTSRKNAHETLLERFDKEKIDILIGTQMVAKGLDFENVTLVGVIAADIGLNVDDFRAAERTFCVLTQVSGRAGRGQIKGRSIIQTYSPDEGAIRYAKNHDYGGFFSEEIKMRRAMLYPPFCRLVKITVSSVMENAARDSIGRIKKDIIENAAEYGASQNIGQILGPVPSSVFKVGNKYRFNLIIKCRSAEKLTPLFAWIREKHLKNKDNRYISLSIDKNPY